MRYTHSLGSWVALAGLMVGAIQASPPAPLKGLPEAPALAPAAPCCPPPAPACAAAPECLIYGGAEALFWWVKSPSVVPLVTTNVDPNTIAALNEPGTRTLFGGSGNPVDFGSLTGVRGRIGVLLPGGCAGFEASLFGLPEHGISYTTTAAGGDGPVIAVPYNSLVPIGFNPAGETTLNPGNTPSQVSVAATTRLWGGDALGVAKLYASDRARVMLVGGFKYLDLEEGLTVNQLFLDTQFPGVLQVRDSFQTRNQFYGLALGLQAGFSYEFLSVDVCGKVAFGPTHQQLRVAGQTTGSFGFFTGETPAGLFALPSNSGEWSRNSFTVIPEVQVKVNCEVTNYLRVFVGYDLLYSNNVIRAASQVDRNLNPTQNTAFLLPTGAPAPVAGFNRTEYWAQGISTGVQFQY